MYNKYNNIGVDEFASTAMRELRPCPQHHLQEGFDDVQ